MIFLACVETWDISYNRVINNNILKDFLVCFLEDFFFWKIRFIFLHGEIFEFP